MASILMAAITRRGMHPLALAFLSYQLALLRDEFVCLCFPMRALAQELEPARIAQSERE